jgi:hypothetical protein
MTRKADWTQRLLQPRDGTLKVPCKGCSVIMYIPPSKAGQRAYCTIECKSNRAVIKERRNWAERLFEPRDGTVSKPCETCGRLMHLPRSKVSRLYCSIECRKLKTKRELTKFCESCGLEFVGWNRSQRYCSQKCNPATERISSPEILLLAQEGKRRAIAEGRFSYPSGPKNKLWKGGPKALRQRQIASGKSAAWLRLYRRKNPDQVRMFAQRRKNRKLGKLPYGTLSTLRRAQKDRCAICSKKLRQKGHLDHIQPLARGGEHKPANLQLLCAPCNLRKSSKDPIDYMQSIGRLL